MISAARPEAGTLWWGVVAIVLVGIGLGAGHINGDGFLYIAHGRAILDGGALPDRDPFSATSMQGPLILHHLAAMIAFALAERHLGIEVLIRLSGAASALALALFLWPARRSVVAVALSTGLIAVALWLDREQVFETRGQSWAYLGIVAVLALIERLRAGHERVFVLFLPLSAVWAATHPSFVIGIVLPLLVGLATLSETAARRPRAGPLLLGALAAAMGALVSPYGPALVVDVVRLIGDPTTSRIEHMRSPLLEPASVALLACVLWVGLWRRRRGPVAGRRTEVIVLVALLAAWLISRRYVWFVVAWAIPMLRDVVIAARLDDRVRALASRAPAVVALVVAALLFSRLATRPVDPWKNVPVAEMDALEAAGVDGLVVSEFAWGGYLMYRWGTSRLVFIDGRNNLYNNGVFDDYLQLVFVGPAVAEVLDVYRADAILWPRGWKLEAWLTARPEQWRELHRGVRASVWVRQPGAPSTTAGPVSQTP